MTYSLIPVPIHLVLIVLYMIARNRNDLKKTAIIQPSITFLAIVIAGLSYLSPYVNPAYTTWILVGLVLCFIGDIFNIDMTNDKILFAAMVIFFIAYVEYAVAFTRFGGFHTQDWLIGALMLVVYILLIRLYWKGLGNFRIPVMIFVLVITFMVTRAISTLFSSQFSALSAWLVAFGGPLLFMGDVEYGLHRFHKPLKFHLGPLYYAGGQLLVALSCAYILFR